MDIGLIRGVITVLVLALFIGIWAWSFSRNRQPEFDAAAHLPLGDDRKPPGQTPGGEDLEEQQS